jgi:hypothetical protein
MFLSSEHIKYLIETKEQIKTVDGKKIKVLEFNCNFDDKIMSSWAKHFRNHYCLDTDIESLRQGTGLTKKDYLTNYVFPDISVKPGPSVRAGDFGEILIYDYLQFILGYWTPRNKYSNKASRNESVKGTDILGFYIYNENGRNPEDILAIFEAKAQFVNKLKTSRLQDAINSSALDYQIRKGESLNYLKSLFLKAKNIKDAMRVERFQRPEDSPYTEIYGAAAIISTHLYDEELIQRTDTRNHPNTENINLLIIRGEKFMDLVHELYRRAADEA